MSDHKEIKTETSSTQHPTSQLQTNKKYLVLTVDDSEMNHKIIGKILSDDYRQVCAMSGKECINQIAQQSPDLVLLDVTMPEMDGYETCIEIRKQESMKHTPILFLSGRCSLEEKLKGYEVGGDDYITKPFESSELLAKMSKAIQAKSGIDQLTAKANRAVNIAYHALKDNNNISLCLNFFNKIFTCNTIDELVEHFFAAVQEMGLSVTLQLKMGQKFFNYSSDGVERELEQALLSKMHGGPEEISIGKRWVLNCESQAVLVKNMPSGDEKSTSALKDYLLTLMKGVQFRLEEIVAHAKLEHQRDVLATSMEKAANSLAESESQFSGLLSQSHNIFEKLVREIEDVITELNMHEYQEKAIYSLVRSAEGDMDKLHACLIKIEEDFSTVVTALSKTKLA